MIRDTLTVIWKEVNEFLLLSNRPMRSGWLLLIGVIGFLVAMPALGDESWLTASLTLWLGFPPLFVTLFIPDSFAGERERHTLETLLATRLPDRAIFFGKYLAPIIVVWLTIEVGMFLSLLPLNLLHSQGALLFFSFETFISGTLLSLLLCMYGGSIGITASLSAPSVQIAQVRTGLAMTFTFLLPFLLLFLATQVFGFTLEQIVGFFRERSALEMTALVSGVLFVLTASLLTIAMGRFRRSRLI